MSALLKKFGLALLLFLLKNKDLRDELRTALSKSENKADDLLIPMIDPVLDLIASKLDGAQQA